MTASTDSLQYAHAASYLGLDLVSTMWSQQEFSSRRKRGRSAGSAREKRGRSLNDQSMASEWLESLVTHTNDDGANFADFFAQRGRYRKGSERHQTKLGIIQDEHNTDSNGHRGSGNSGEDGAESEAEGSRNSSRIKKASFPDTNGISSLLSRKQLAARKRAVSASRNRRSRWILSRGSNNGRVESASSNRLVRETSASNVSIENDSDDDIEHHYKLLSLPTRDKNQSELRLDESTTLLQLQRHNNLRQARLYLRSTNGSSVHGAGLSPSPPSSRMKEGQNRTRTNQYYMNQLSVASKERERGSHQLYSAYAETVAAESKLRCIMLNKGNAIRKGLMHDLQKKLSIHLSVANQCLAKAMADASGEEDSKYETVVSSLHKIEIAQKRKNQLSQEYRELRSRLDDVLINATPAPGSLKFNREKRRQVRGRLREKLKTKLASQKVDRDEVRALKQSRDKLRAQIKEQEEEMQKVRMVWNLALDGLLQEEEHNYSSTDSITTSADKTGVEDQSNSEGLSDMIMPERSSSSNNASHNDANPYTTSPITNRNSSRLEKRALAITARDLGTAVPLHMNDARSTSVSDGINETVDGKDGAGEDEEEQEWKEFEIKHNTSLSALSATIMPQSYIDAQFMIRLQACQIGFQEIEKELLKTVCCDVCHKNLVNPRITRMCSHVMCFRCLGTKRPAANYMGGAQNANEVSNKNDTARKNDNDNHIVCPVCGAVTEARADGIMSLLQAKLVPFTSAKAGSATQEKDE